LDDDHFDGGMRDGWQEKNRDWTAESENNEKTPILSEVHSSGAVDKCENFQKKMNKGF